MYSKGTDRGRENNGLNDCVVKCNTQHRIKDWRGGEAHQNTHSTVDNKKED